MIGVGECGATNGNQPLRLNNCSAWWQLALACICSLVKWPTLSSQYVKGFCLTCHEPWNTQKWSGEIEHAIYCVLCSSWLSKRLDPNSNKIDWQRTKCQWITETMLLTKHFFLQIPVSRCLDYLNRWGLCWGGKHPAWTNFTTERKSPSMYLPLLPCSECLAWDEAFLHRPGRVPWWLDVSKCIKSVRMDRDHM